MNRRSFFEGLAAALAALFAPWRAQKPPRPFGTFFPPRTELTVLSADNPKARTIGFRCFENVGIGAFNSRGVTRLTIDRKG
jgi:hypothetical protein